MSSGEFPSISIHEFTHESGVDKNQYNIFKKHLNQEELKSMNDWLYKQGYTIEHDLE